MEIVARATEEAGKKRRCETFGDELKGLNIKELEKVLATNPTQPVHPPINTGKTQSLYQKSTHKPPFK